MNDKTRRILHIVFACVAVISVIAVVLLAGRKIVGKTKTEATTSPSEISEVAGDSANTPEKETDKTDGESETETPKNDVSVSVHKPTEATTDPDKNYTVFIDPTEFDYTEKKGVTTAVLKSNDKVRMTVTPVKNMSYGEYCAELLDNYGDMGESERLGIENANRAFRSQTGDKDNDIITTVYCVDDGKGGCIEIKYQTPVSAKKYAQTFEVFLTMFKVL